MSESESAARGYEQQTSSSALKHRDVALGVAHWWVMPLTEAIAPLSNEPTAAMLSTPEQAGSALATSLQGKPVVVQIYSPWCSSCQALKPVLKTLRQKEGNSVHWVQFDVTDSVAARQSAVRAEALGLGPFFNANHNQTSLVSIVNTQTGQAIKTFRAQPNLDSYLLATDKTWSMIGG